MIKEHASVLATKDLSERVLLGCMGVVVFVFSSPKLAYEVEFFDRDGHALEVITAKPSEVELIHPDNDISFLA